MSFRDERPKRTSSQPPSRSPRPRMRRAPTRTPPLAVVGGDATIELDVRVRPGTESASEAELRSLGAKGIEVRNHGELRVTEPGPLSAMISATCALAIFGVLRMPSDGLPWLDSDDGLAAAVELAALVSSLNPGKPMRTMRVSGGQDLIGDRTVLGRLTGRLARRLGLMPSPFNPDLVVMVRGAPRSTELAVRLIRSQEI